MTVLDLKATTKLFFDRPAVIKRIGAGTAAAFKQIGFDWRDRAKKQIKPARMKTLSEMTDEERQSYRTRKRIAAQEGRPLPKRPRASSKAGDFPRSHTGLLRKLQLFALDPDRESVVMGPAKLNAPVGKNIPEILERGGVNDHGHFIEARPNTIPAFDFIKPTIPKRFQDRF